MNKLRLLAGLSVIAGLIITGCTKEDGTPPYIRLNGSADTSLVLNTSYRDPGVFAKDETDGIIDDIIIVSTLNKDSVGDYTIIYKAVDAKGNEASVTRNVHVKTSLAAMQGFYNASQPCIGTADSVYSLAVVPSNTKNNTFIINQVDKYKNVSLRIEFLNATDLVIPFQRIVTTATDTVTIYSGGGTIVKGGFDLHYSGLIKDSLEHYYGCEGKYRKQ